MRLTQPGKGRMRQSDLRQRFPVARYLPVFSAGALSEPYEGLEAEECGILDGCAHGRCVRVPEGFTCDCFDGYRLDITRMSCVGEEGKEREG